MIFLLHFVTAILAFAEPNVVLDNSQKNIIFKSDKIESKISLKIPENMKFENSPKYFTDGLLNYVIADLEGSDVATVFLIAVDKVGKTLWSIDLEAFNASAPLIESKYIYISGIGKVFKINKTDGKIIWSHSGLYDNHHYRFNGGETIQIKNGIVFFSDKVHVNDHTGEILGVHK